MADDADNLHLKPVEAPFHPGNTAFHRRLTVENTRVEPGEGDEDPLGNKI